MTAIYPYLLFNGNCKEVFDFYKSVFGGEFSSISQFKDMPAQPGMPELPDSEKEKIMHVSLPIGDHAILMGSDAMAGRGDAVFGNNVSISVAPKSKEEADRLFNALAEGGTISMPISDMFWGAYFGMCDDKYGIHWMINYADDSKGYDVKN